MLLIAIVLLAGAIIAKILDKRVPNRFWANTDYDIVYFILSLALGIFLMFWLACYAKNLSYIQQFKATKNTIEVQRKADIDPLERAKLTEEIIEMNSWLAKAQYWNGTMFGQAVPDAVMLLEPIE